MVESKTLKNLFSSEEWKGFFHNLSKITGFCFSIYDDKVMPPLSINENPACKLIRSFFNSSKNCPDSCEKIIFKALDLNEPKTYKCYSKIISFSVPINYLNEKAVIIGRNSFTSEKDFREFSRTAKDRGIQEIPDVSSLSYTDENDAKNTSHYVHQTINYLLNNLLEKNKTIEKFRRLTVLMDTNILEGLSKNKKFLYRYIADTIDFIVAPHSIAILTLDPDKSTYKTVSTAGKYKDSLMKLQFDQGNALIRKILTARAPVFPVDPGTEKCIPAEVIGKTELLYLFPIFISNAMNGLIGVFDRKLPGEDIKIISALRDQIEVTLENQALHFAADKKMEKLLNSISDLSISIAPVLNSEQLVQIILEKLIQLLKAEQGSLMLLNQETDELLVEAKINMDKLEREGIRVRRGEGIAGKVLENGEPLLVEDLEKDPRIKQKNKSRYKTKSFVSIPIRIDGRMSGIFNMSDKISGEAFDKNDLKLIQAFIANAAIAIEKSLMYKKNKELKQLSLTDPLTGVLNRRYLDNRLYEEIARYGRYKNPFSLLMVDIDGFKEYNDTFGHIAGDNTLKTITTTIIGSLRDIDILTRFGGDEFVVILPQTPKANAINIANRTKDSVEQDSISPKQQLPSNITISIGLTSYPDDASSATELLAKADEALYIAKKKGGNKLVYF